MAYDHFTSRNITTKEILSKTKKTVQNDYKYYSERSEGNQEADNVRIPSTS